jgi:Double zinc ribbon
MPVYGIFGIDGGTVNTIVSLLVLLLVVVWLALVYWTYADARRRITDPMLIWTSAAASLCFPFVGTLVYMIVRPPEYIEDVRERELEMQAAEARLAQFNYMLCPYCDYEVEKDFLRCPSCLRKLKDPCASCRRPLDPTWTLCPYCETEVLGASSAQRLRRRRETGEEPALEAPPHGF